MLFNSEHPKNNIMKRHKIYYVPGMISLIFLPILCVWYLNEHKNVLRNREIIVCNKYIPKIKNEKFYRFDTSLLSSPNFRRRYIELKINKSTNLLNTLKLIEDNTKKIVKSNDTINGIHIILDDSVSYQAFISILDIFPKYSKFITTTEVNKAFREHKDLYSPQYLIFQNHFWFYNLKYPKLENEVWECNLKCINVDYKPTFKQEIIEWIENQKILFKLWPFFLVFIAFSIISIRYIKNKTTK